VLLGYAAGDRQIFTGSIANPTGSLRALVNRQVDAAYATVCSKTYDRLFGKEKQ
jgi:hypothetical protein